ncbi:MAG: hypothetical protein QUS33_08165 [Dehalococcoidia bacterium]|nr:hypothetical protein [Dehalococcoidia bacterium]
MSGRIDKELRKEVQEKSPAGGLVVSLGCELSAISSWLIAMMSGDIGG